jgi:hypothetical protein
LRPRIFRGLFLSGCMLVLSARESTTAACDKFAAATEWRDPAHCLLAFRIPNSLLTLRFKQELTAGMEGAFHQHCMRVGGSPNHWARQCVAPSP